VDALYTFITRYKSSLQRMHCLRSYHKERIFKLLLVLECTSCCYFVCIQQPS